MLLRLLTFNPPWREFGVESRNETLVLGEKVGRVGLQEVRYFQGLILWAQFWLQLIPRKTLKQQPNAKICAWMQVLPTPSPESHTHWPSPRLFGGVSELPEVPSPVLQSSFCPKWKVSFNSNVVHFLKKVRTIFEILIPVSPLTWETQITAGCSPMIPTMPGSCQDTHCYTHRPDVCISQKQKTTLR